jgi:hypothetical protein
MVQDISEAAATGETAAIYSELRVLYGVPYVSAIHRIIAGRPGFLEWAWEATAPAFRSGAAQEAGWRCARELEITPLESIPAHVLGVWGIDQTERERIAKVCETFVRVAPVNMIFAGLVTQLLLGVPTGGDGAHEERWVPPPPITGDAVEMAELATMTPDLRETTLLFATDMDGAPFVPGLYRMLAHWPGLLAHLAVTLQPRLRAPETVSAFDTLRARIDAAVTEVLAGMPRTHTVHPLPSIADQQWFTSVSRTYRQTSPEMVVSGRLVKAAVGG